MNNVLIHIGYHKTGTTWLQTELFTSKSDYFIPISKNKKGPSTLARDFIYSKDGYLLNSFCKNEKIIQENLNTILSNDFFYDEKIPVISHERLSGNPHSSGFDSSIIAGRIHKVFTNAKILIVIREQSSWILSNYFQYLSIGGTHNLKKYLNTKYDGKKPGFSPYHLEFHHLISDYQSRFDKKNVLVLPYEIFKTDKNLFLKTLGMFLEKEICNSKQMNFNKIHNAKSNHYINYKLRMLNLFIRSSSVNNHSNLNNKVNRSLAISVKKILSRCIPQKYNDLIQTKRRNEIDQWSNGRFNKSNRITQELIGVNLNRLGYKTTNTNKD